MSLLPSKPDTSATAADAEPRVIGVDSDDADDVISALSSETARELLAELHEDPAPPSELADRVDTSLQNAQYHLQKLQSAGAVSVVDTAYSAKGREMDVYAPADQPLVIFAGDDEKTTGLKAAISRLIGGFGVLALGSLAVQKLYGDASEKAGGVAPAGDAGDAGGQDGPATAPTTAQSKETVEPTSGYSQGIETTVDGNQNVKTFDQTAEGDYVVYTDVNETTLADANLNASNVTAGDNVTVIVKNESATQEFAEPTATTVTDPVATTTAETVNQTTTTAAPEAADTATTAAATAGIEPGILFFAGGLAILTLWMTVWYVRNQ